MIAVLATCLESELADSAPLVVRARAPGPGPETQTPSPEPRSPTPDPRAPSYNQPMRKCLVAGVGLLFVSCSTSAQPIKPQSASDVVATVGATSITLAQVDELALQQPASSFGSLKLSQAMYEARRMALDDLVGDALI